MNRTEIHARPFCIGCGYFYAVHGEHRTDCTGAADMPRRVQQRRTKGWRKPLGAVSVVRGTRWGNPFKVGLDAGSNADAAVMFRAHLAEHPELAVAARRQLRGKTLMCWCALDEPCHADVLLEIANSGGAA